MKAWNSTLNASTKPMKRSEIKPRVKPVSGMLRTASLTAPLTAPAKASLSYKPRMRKCAICRTPFKAFDMRVKWCSPDCGLAVAQRELAKKDRKDLKARKEAMKSIPELKADAQKAFNAYIRYRDKDLPCICCDGWGGEWSRGGIWDAGHFRSRGSADHLRFDERNVHKQLKQCNKWGAGRATDYRIGLIKRIGLANVEALEADQVIVKWTREVLVAIKIEYTKKLKQLMARAGT